MCQHLYFIRTFEAVLSNGEEVFCLQVTVMAAGLQHFYRLIFCVTKSKRFWYAVVQGSFVGLVAAVSM